MPYTKIASARTGTRNTSNLVFFVSIAFSLIPANFITIFVKEKSTSSNDYDNRLKINNNNFNNNQLFRLDTNQNKKI